MSIFVSNTVDDFLREIRFADIPETWKLYGLVSGNRISLVQRTGVPMIVSQVFQDPRTITRAPVFLSVS